MENIQVIGLLALEWVNAKEEAKTAKDKRRLDRELNGDCPGFVFNDPFRDPCFRGIPQEFDMWCDTCKRHQEFHVAYLNASRKQSTAFRKLKKEIKKHSTTSNRPGQ